MIRDDYLKGSAIDVVVFPGGSSKKQKRMLSGVGQRKLMEFIRDGGGFVGACVHACVRGCVDASVQAVCACMFAVSQVAVWGLSLIHI